MVAISDGDNNDDDEKNVCLAVAWEEIMRWPGDN